MKLFLVCNSLGGGGAERVHVNLANGFAQRGHQVYLVTDIYQDSSYPVDGSVHVLPLCPKTNNKLVKWGKAVPWLRKNIKQYRPDVVIGNMQLCSIISRLASMGTHTPVVLTIHHAMESKEYKFSKVEMFLDGHTSSCYNATTVLTTADRDLLKQKYHKTKRIYVMPNPLTFTPVTVTPEGGLFNGESMIQKEKVILAAGRLDNWRYKGWDILIQAAKKLSPLLLQEGWTICIAGGGTEETQQFLETLRHDAGVEDCLQFIGYRKDMKDLFQKASVFCLSSRSEGLPMVLIEAMSQGCAPVACDNLDRTKEIITNEKEGLLFKTADVEDLSRQLTRMITDKDYRDMVQRSAVQRSTYYQMDHILVMWEDLLKELR